MEQRSRRSNGLWMEVETGESATQETDGETGDVSWELEAGDSGPT